MNLTSAEVFDLIEQIASTSSKNEKEDIIRLHHSHDLFVRVLKAALNPFITYGIAKRPAAVISDSGHDFDDKTWMILDQLAKRNLTGNAAITAVQCQMVELNAKSAELFWRIVSKDLKAGFSESTVNKAIPGLIPTFDCMLAHPFSEHKHKLKYPLIAEPKLDGVRVLTFVSLEDQSVHFFSRSGKEFFTFEHLKKPILSMVSDYRSELMAEACRAYDEAGLPDGDDTDTAALDALYDKYGVDDALELVFDAEVVSGQFNKTVSEVRKKDSQAVDAKLAIFDVLPMQTFTKDDKGGCEVAGVYFDRRKRLEVILSFADEKAPIIKLPTFVVHNEGEIHELYEKVRARGMEGLIIKDPNGLYHRRRNHAWSKIKAEESVDLLIVDAEEGADKYTGMLGALVVDFKGVRVNVGTGLTDEQRRTFWEAFKEGSLVGRLVEIGFHEVTPDGSLRHPRFMRFRDDKIEVSA